MTRERMVTIYVLRDPRFEEDVDAIRYVGQTVQMKRARLYLHIRDGQKQQRMRTPRRLWLAELSAHGVDPQMVTVETVSLSAGDESEARWIMHFRELGCSLVNLSASGQKGQKWANDEARMLRSIDGKELWQDPARRQVRSELMKKKWQETAYREAALAPESRARVDAATVEYWSDSERRAKRGQAIRDAKSSEDQRRRQSLISKALWDDPGYQEKTISRMTVARNTAESKAKTSQRQKALWADPEWKEKTRAAVKAWWAKRKETQACRTV